ncbi:MAG: hypothetical protein ACOC2J_00600 [bacterium]
MVAGEASAMPTNILKPMRPMKANIATERGEAPVGSNLYFNLYFPSFYY